MSRKSVKSASSPRKRKKMSTKKRFSREVELASLEELAAKKNKLQEVKSLIRVGALQFKFLGTKDMDTFKYLEPLAQKAYDLESEIIAIEDQINANRSAA